MPINKKRYTSKENKNAPSSTSDVFPRLSMDILSGLPESKLGHRHILLMIDNFSHWCECVPLQTQDALQVAKALYNEFFTRYGMCSSILSDRGQNFVSRLVSALCDIFQVTRIRTSSFPPQTNGLCERQNATISQTLRAYCQEHQDNWHDLLHSITMAFRMSPGVQITGYSPFQILFGREMKLPIDVALLPQENIKKAPKQHIEDILKKLSITRQIVRENLQENQDKMKDKHDKTASESDYIEGQYVLLKQTHVAAGKKKKFQPKWKGPYYITKKYKNDTYIIRNVDTQKEHNSPVHASRLKVYNDPRDIRPAIDEIPEGFFDETKNDTDQSSQNSQNEQNEVRNQTEKDHGEEDPAHSQSNSENKDNTQNENKKTQNDSKMQNTPNENEETQDNSNTQNTPNEIEGTQDDPNIKYYPVEKLIKAKLISGKKHFLVKWVGNYSDSWEPEENIPEQVKHLYITSKS